MAKNRSRLNHAAIAAQHKAVERIADEWANGRTDEAVLDDALEKLQRLCGAPIGSAKVVASHDRPWPHTAKADAYQRQLESRQRSASPRVTIKPQGNAKGTQQPSQAQPTQGKRTALQAYQQRAQQAQARLRAHEVAEARRAAQQRAQEQATAAEQRAARIAALKERLRDEQAQKELAALWRFRHSRID